RISVVARAGSRADQQAVRDGTQRILPDVAALHTPCASRKVRNARNLCRQSESCAGHDEGGSDCNQSGFASNHFHGFLPSPTIFYVIISIIPKCERPPTSGRGAVQELLMKVQERARF